LEQAHFAFALEAPKLTDPKLYDARVFTSILGGGMSSRLFQQLREKRGLCYSIFSFIETLSDTGSIMIYSGTGKDQVGELSNVVAEELKKLTSNVLDNEVKRAKAQMKAGMLMALENPFSRCERMARSLTIWGRIIDLEEIIEKIEEVNVQKVKDFGLALLNNKKAGLSLYGPITKAPELSHLLSVLNK
jgi:predicted Zn-dependent peptidase